MCVCVVVNEAIIKAIDKFTITIQFTSQAHTHTYIHMNMGEYIYSYTFSRTPMPTKAHEGALWLPSGKEENYKFYFHNKHCSDACFCCNKQLLKI